MLKKEMPLPGGVSLIIHLSGIDFTPKNLFVDQKEGATDKKMIVDHR